MEEMEEIVAEEKEKVEVEAIDEWRLGEVPDQGGDECGPRP